MYRFANDAKKWKTVQNNLFDYTSTTLVQSPGYPQELLIHNVPFLRMMRKKNQQQQHETKKLVD